MKFSKIAALAKRKKTAILMQDADGVQWLSIGSAVYELDGMPPLDKDTVLTVLGVSGESREKWHAAEKDGAEKLLENDAPGEVEITADDAGVSIIYGGKLLTPIYTMDGMIWIDTELLAPTDRKEPGYRRFFLRETENGERMIAVKEGMILTALIMEYCMEGDALPCALGMLAERCRTEWNRTEEEKRNDNQIGSLQAKRA